MQHEHGKRSHSIATTVMNWLIWKLNLNPASERASEKIIEYERTSFKVTISWLEEVPKKKINTIASPFARTHVYLFNKWNEEHNCKGHKQSKQQQRAEEGERWLIKMRDKCTNRSINKNTLLKFTGVVNHRHEEGNLNLKCVSVCRRCYDSKLTISIFDRILNKI